MLELPVIVAALIASFLISGVWLLSRFVSRSHDQMKQQFTRRLASQERAYQDHVKQTLEDERSRQQQSASQLWWVIRSLSQELQATQQAKAALQQDWQASQQQQALLSQAQQQIESLQQQVESLQEQLNHAHTKLQAATLEQPHQSQHLHDLQEQLKLYEDVEQELQAHIQALETENQALRLENQSLQSTPHIVTPTVEPDYSRQNHAIQIFEHHSHQQERTASRWRQFLRKQSSLIVESVGEAIDVAEAIYADTLEIWQSARYSAADSNFARPHDVYRALWAIAQVGKRYFDNSGRLGQGIYKVFQEYGLDYSNSESKSTRSNRKLLQMRTFKHGEQIKTMLQHVKVGTGRGKDKTLRIYFDFDDVLQKVQIGYCGNHLPTWSIS